MKKSIYFYALALILVQAQLVSAETITSSSSTASTTASTTPLSISPITNTIKQGVKGIDVKNLQKLLATDASIFKGEITGFFGKVTAEAIKKLQERLGIEQTGTVGPKTREAINNLLEQNKEEDGKSPGDLLKRPFGPSSVRILSVKEGEGLGHAVVVPAGNTGTSIMLFYKQKGDRDETVVASTTGTTIASTTQPSVVVPSRPAAIFLGSCAETGTLKYELKSASGKPTKTILPVEFKQFATMGTSSIRIKGAGGETLACGNIYAPKPLFKKFDLDNDGNDDMKKFEKANQEGELKDKEKLDSMMKKNPNEIREMIKKVNENMGRTKMPSMIDDDDDDKKKSSTSSNKKINIKERSDDRR